MIQRFLFSLSFPLLLSLTICFSQQDLLQRCRANCVKVISPSAKVSGTGFFLNDQQIITCFHLVATIDRSGATARWQMRNDIKVILANGDTLDGTCVTPPSKDDPAPLDYDFAVVQLSSKPAMTIEPNPIASDELSSNVGAEIAFTGYPMQTPAMLSQKGMIAGISNDKKTIYLQAAMNQGNSGGALLNTKGEVIAIVNMQESGTAQAITDLNMQIETAQQDTAVLASDINALTSKKEMIQTLDAYMSNGLGYATSIKYLREFIKRHAQK